MISARMLGLEVVRVSAGEELVKCPFHNDSHSSAWFNPVKGLFWCAVCNRGYDVYQLLQKMGSDIDIAEVMQETRDEIPDLDLVLPPHDIPFGIKGVDIAYYRQRGVTKEVAERYMLEYNVVNHSIIFPVINLGGARIGSVQRFINPEAAGTRYKKSGTMTPIWPLSFLTNFAQGDYLIVTEGVWSCLRIATWSVKNEARGTSFTLFGARANQEIVDVLRPFRPVFLYDNDKAGKNACVKMRQLAPHWHSFTLAKAPDDMDDIEIGELIKKLWRKIHE